MGIEFDSNEPEETHGTKDESSSGEDVKVSCTCANHYEQKEIDTILNCSPKKVFDALFGENLDFLMFMGKRRENYDISYDKTWSDSGEKIVKYKTPLKINNPLINVKFADCTETIKLVKRDEERYL